MDKEYIDNLKKYLPDYLVSYHNINLNNFFRCLNPSHEDRNPSMRYSKKYNICKCFSCNERYDIFDVIGIDYGINNFIDQVKKVTELYNEKIPEYEIIEEETEEKVDYSKYYSICYKSRNKCDYLQTRGIDKKLQEKYFIGYDDKNERIIFPINDNCYFARSIKNNSKIKSKGKSYLWNEKLLDDSNEDTLIYITESIIDSLSLLMIDPSIKTISLNGLPNIKRLTELVKEKNYNGYFVLAFDNDSSGINAQMEAKKILGELKVKCFPITLISNFDNKVCKDLNEALLTNRELLEKNIKYFDENFQKIILEKSKEVVSYEL